MAAKGKSILIDISSSSSSDVNGDEDDSSSDIASISRYILFILFSIYIQSLSNSKLEITF